MGLYVTMTLVARHMAQGFFCVHVCVHKLELFQSMWLHF